MRRVLCRSHSIFVAGEVGVSRQTSSGDLSSTGVGGNTIESRSIVSRSRERSTSESSSDAYPAGGTTNGNGRNARWRTSSIDFFCQALKSFASGNVSLPRGTNVSSIFALRASFGISSSVSQTRSSLPGIVSNFASTTGVFASPFRCLLRTGRSRRAGPGRYAWPPTLT